MYRCERASVYLLFLVLGIGAGLIGGAEFVRRLYNGNFSSFQIAPNLSILCTVSLNQKELSSSGDGCCSVDSRGKTP